MQRFLLGFSGSFLLWLALTQTLSSQSLWLGVGISALVTLLAWSHMALLDDIKLSPALPWHVLRFFAVFSKALVIANLDMARRVLHPALPINPGMVTVTTQLDSALGRLWLANAITLTPGTLSVDVEDKQLTIHWIDTPTDAQAKLQQELAAFERSLGAFLK